MVLLLHGLVERYRRPTAEDSLQLVRRELEALWSDGADFGRHSVQVVRRPEVRYPGINLRDGYSQLSVFRIRIYMFLGLPDPDPLVRGMDPAPDPSIIKKKSEKNLDSYCFETSFGRFIF
jgi:hypothetical protein